MPRSRRSLVLILLVGFATAVAPAVRADTGVQVGGRGGIQLLDDPALRHEDAPFVGAEARLSFELSPLTFTAGIGIMHQLNPLFGLRTDVRY